MFSLSNENYSDVLENFKWYLFLEEYEKAFLYGVQILEMFKSKSLSYLYNTTKSYIINETISKIKDLNSKENEEQWDEKGKSMLRNIKIFITELQVEEEFLLVRNVKNNNKIVTSYNFYIQKVISLRDKLFSKNLEILNFVNENFSSTIKIRKKRSSTNNNYNIIEEMRDFLEISELIIISSNDKNKINSEKDNISKRLNIYLQKLCWLQYKQPQVINVGEKKFNLFYFFILSL